MNAHYFRRAFHVVGIGVFPLLYYFGLLKCVTPAIAKDILMLLIVAVLLFELVRLRLGFLFFGQRPYEKHAICATTWTTVSLLMLLLFSPWVGLSMAIAWTCALVDPLLGEMRAHQVSGWIVFLTGCVVAFVIWLLSGFSFILSLVMGIVIVAVEKPNFRWIDDNALMILVPLVLWYLIILI